MGENDNKHKVGELVYAKVRPDIKLTVRRYIKRIYYCTSVDDPEAKDQVFFEREIVNKGTQ